MTESNADKSNHIEKAVHELWERNVIWETPQFTVADACTVTGATPKALEHFINPTRGLVRLIGSNANPGTGKRRLFTGVQLAMIKAAFVMSAMGFPQRWSFTLTQIVERRANLITFMNRTEEDQVLVTYPNADGSDWAFHSVSNQVTEKPILPPAFLVLEIDRLILETKSQLEAIVAGIEPPSFNHPEPPPFENPYSPKVNFFRAWTKDDQDRWVYVGLNYEETQVLLESQDSHLNGDDLVVEPRHSRKHFDQKLNDLLVELHGKHESARHAVILEMKPNTS